MGKKEELESTLKQIKKAYGEGSIMWLGDSSQALRIESIPTGSLALDIALGVGGIPKGRITEIFGSQAAGKTSLVLHIIAEVQRRGGTAAFIDTENALDPVYSEVLGVNLGEMLISQPSSGEEALEIAEQLIRSEKIDIVVIDSVAALVPRAELEGSIGDSHVALQARLMSQALRKLSKAIAQTKTAVIFTNQTRSKIGGMAFGPATTTSGGMALGFYASMRLQMWSSGKIEEGADRVGGYANVKVAKNKCAPPFKIAKFDIIYGQGIVRSRDLVNTATSLGIIEKKGAWYSYGDQQIGQGIGKSSIALEEDPDLANEIEDKIREKAGLPERFVVKSEA